MSVLGLKSGYTVKKGLSPRDCPWAIPRAQAIFYCISLLSSQYGYSVHCQYCRLTDPRNVPLKAKTKNVCKVAARKKYFSLEITTCLGKTVNKKGTQK